MNRREAAERKIARKMARMADQAYEDHYGGNSSDGSGDDSEYPHKIYLNGSFFGKRTNLGHVRLRQRVYDEMGFDDSEIEHYDEEGDLYVETPERVRCRVKGCDRWIGRSVHKPNPRDPETWQKLGFPTFCARHQQQPVDDLDFRTRQERVEGTGVDPDALGESEYPSDPS